MRNNRHAAESGLVGWPKVAGFPVAVVVLMCALTSAIPARARPKNQNTGVAAPAYVYKEISVKPSEPVNRGGSSLETADGYTATNCPLVLIVYHAFGISDNGRLVGAPPWINSQKFDIEAKMEPSVAKALEKMDNDDRIVMRQRMLQTLLADHFKLTVHREAKNVPAYLLLIADGGSKLKVAKPGDTYRNGLTGPDGRPAIGRVSIAPREGRMTWVGQAVSVHGLCEQLSRWLGRTVIDKTGLTGVYDFSIEFRGNAVYQQGRSEPTQPDPNAHPLLTAIQEQLGLKLDEGNGSVEMIVIDHIEQPSGN